MKPQCPSGRCGGWCPPPEDGNHIPRRDDDGHDEEAAREEDHNREGQARTRCPNKKHSQIEAALEVPKTATEPMTCKQMVEAMAERKLWSSLGGKTPEATLYAALLRELAKKGDAARFVKAAPGRFAAKA